MIAIILGTPVSHQNFPVTRICEVLSEDASLFTPVKSNTIQNRLGIRGGRAREHIIKRVLRCS